MRQRVVSFASLVGIGVSAVLLLRFAPSGRGRGKPAPESPAPIRRITVSPAVARLQAAYNALPRATRVGLALGVPFDELPDRFGSAIRDVIDEQFRAQEEEVRSNLGTGRISRGEYDEECVYLTFVPRHLSRYRISTNGDTYTIILFREPLPGKAVPKKDLHGGPKGICRVR